MAIGTYANYLQKLILTLNGLRSNHKLGSRIAKADLVRSFRNLCESRKISSNHLAFCLCLMELHEYVTQITSHDGSQMYCITKLGNEKLDKAFAAAAKIPRNFRSYYKELQNAMDFLPFEDAIRDYMKRMTEKALQQAKHGEDVSMGSASVDLQGADYENDAMDIDSPSIDCRALSVQSYPSPPGTPRVGRGTPVDGEGYTSHGGYRSLSPLTDLSGSRESSMRPTPTPQDDREKLGLLRNERTMKQTLMLRRRAGLLDKRHVSQPSSSYQDDGLTESRIPLGSPWSGSLRSSQSLSSLRSSNRFKRQPTFSPTISELVAIQERRENRESSAGFTPPPSHGRDTPSMWIKVEEEDEDYGLWDGQDGLVTPRAESYSFTPRSSSYASEGEYQASLGEVIIPATPTYSVIPSCDSQTSGSVSEQSEQSEVEDMLVGSNGERPGARARARSPPLSPRSPRAFSPPPYPSNAVQRGLAKKLSREFRRATSYGELRGRDMPSAIQASSSGVREGADPTAANVAVDLDNAGLGPTRTSRGRTRADDYLDDIRQQEALTRMRPIREPSTAPSESDFVPSEAPTSPRREIFGLGLDLGEPTHSPRERELRRCMSQPDIIGASHANGNGSAHGSIRGSRSPSVLSFDSNWHSSWTGTPSALGQGTEHQTMSFGLAGQLTGAPGVGVGAGAALASTTPQCSPFSSGHSPRFEFDPPREASEGPFVDLALRGRVPSANHGMTTDSEACSEIDVDERGQVDFSDHSSISATPRSSTSFRALSSVSREGRPLREGGIARRPVQGQEQELLLQTSLPASAVDSPAVFNRLMFQTLQKVEEMVSIWDRIRADMDNGEDEDQFSGEVEHGNANASLYDFQEADREAERVLNPDTTLSIESGFQAGARSLIDDSELAADFASLSNQKKGLVYLAKEIDKLRAEVRVLKAKARLGSSPAGRAEETKGDSAWIAKELLRLAQALTQK